MSYLHCHKCKWSQDDFWNFEIKWKNIFKWTYRPFGYNPLSLMLETIAINIKPHFIIFDKWWAKENGFKLKKIFSWHLLLFEIKNIIKSIFNQKYRTYKAYKKAEIKGNLICPNCKTSNNLDVD